MEEVAKEVNKHAKSAKQPEKSVDEVAMGFIRVANETMCRPIRALTQMRVRLLLLCQVYHQCQSNCNAPSAHSLECSSVQAFVRSVTKLPAKSICRQMCGCHTSR